VHDHRSSRSSGRIDRRRAVAAAVAACAVAGAGLAASTALAGGLGGLVALTTTVVPDPPPATTPLPKPDPPPLPKPPPPPAPRHVSPPAPPPVVHVSPPPPPVVHVSPPPSPPPAPVVTYSAPVSPPPAPVRPLVFKRPAKPKPHRAKPHRPKPAAPVYVSRGAGGPARSAPLPAPRDQLLTVDTELVAVTPTPSSGFHAGLFLAFVAGCGLLLLGASLLPAWVLRPASVHAILAPHRIDVGLIGVSLLMIGAVLYVLAR
jgi:hypothetical protein